MPLEFFDEQPRVLRGDGIHTLKQSVRLSSVMIECLGCDWYVMRPLAFREEAEHAGYMHITKPTLAIIGTSDVLRPARQRRRKR